MGGGGSLGKSDSVAPFLGSKERERPGRRRARNQYNFLTKTDPVFSSNCKRQQPLLSSHPRQRPPSLAPSRKALHPLGGLPVAGAPPRASPPPSQPKGLGGRSGPDRGGGAHGGSPNAPSSSPTCKTISIRFPPLPHRTLTTSPSRPGERARERTNPAGRVGGTPTPGTLSRPSTPPIPNAAPGACARLTAPERGVRERGARGPRGGRLQLPRPAGAGHMCRPPSG